ncbi:MAG: ferredoxin family protein [Deltaproteobacteria bacterium]|nr:ferredoxin family protein [Deltaproteobacteria bacterium]
MLKQKIEIVIDHKKCLGGSCLNCVDSCPVEVLDWDREQKKVVVVNMQECLVCLACEEACQEDGNKCFKVEGAIRKEFKPSPIQDMWAGTGVVKPPLEGLPAGRSDSRTKKLGF